MLHLFDGKRCLPIVPCEFRMLVCSTSRPALYTGKAMLNKPISNTNELVEIYSVLLVVAGKLLAGQEAKSLLTAAGKIEAWSAVDIVAKYAARRKEYYGF